MDFSSWCILFWLFCSQIGVKRRILHSKRQDFCHFWRRKRLPTKCSISGLTCNHLTLAIKTIKNFLRMLLISFILACKAFFWPIWSKTVFRNSSRTLNSSSSCRRSNAYITGKRSTCCGSTFRSRKKGKSTLIFLTFHIYELKSPIPKVNVKEIP